MPIKFITDKITRSELLDLARERFGDMVKAVVDIANETMTVGGDLHADEEAMLLQAGSKQENLWGINIYPEKVGDDMIEFDSMINIRPSMNNRSRGIESMEIQQKIKSVVNKLIHDA